MSETGMSIDQEQDSAIWHGLGSFSRLPDWLVAARDPDRICETLSHIVPEFNQGGLLLQKCDVGHIRYKEDRWTGLYHLVTALMQYLDKTEGQVEPFPVSAPEKVGATLKRAAAG